MAAGFSRAATAEQAKRQNPRAVASLQDAIAACQQRDWTQARAICEMLLSDRPSDSRVLGLLATVEKQLGHLSDAAHYFEQSLSLDEANADSHHNYAGLLIQSDLQRALRHSERAVALLPNSALFYERLARIQMRLGQVSNALTTARTAINLQPRVASAWVCLAGVLKENGKLEAAAEAAQHAIQLAPVLPQAHSILAVILKDLGRLEQAQHAAERAIQLCPAHIEARYALGLILQARGELQEGLRAFELVLNRDPGHIGALFELSHNLSHADQAVCLLSRAALIDVSRLPIREQSMFHFSVSNAHHHLGDYGVSASHLHRANQLKLQVYPSNASHLIQRTSEPSLFPVDSRQLSKASQRQRIFIVGLPRCGSTLLEMVLSLNPDAVCLGETFALDHALLAWRGQGDSGEPFPDLEQAYEALLGMQLKANQVTVDKQLYNFEHAGLIAELMPEAKIIHCIRHPLDHVLSMYRANLASGNNFTSCLEDAAKVLVAQQRLMNIYGSQYADQISTFDYDSFTDDPVAILKPLLGWLGWSWSNDYLHPESSQAPVATASVIQARQPIHSRSRGSWRHYAAMLEPARAVLIDAGYNEL